MFCALVEVYLHDKFLEMKLLSQRVWALQKETDTINLKIVPMCMKVWFYSYFWTSWLDWLSSLSPCRHFWGTVFFPLTLYLSGYGFSIFLGHPLPPCSPPVLGVPKGSVCFSWSIAFLQVITFMSIVSAMTLMCWCCFKNLVQIYLPGSGFLYPIAFQNIFP